MATSEVANRAKEIRKTLKEKFGLGRNEVSVKSSNYSMGSSIRVCLKVLVSDLDAIKLACQEQESVRYCEASGEILSGGNRFVFVEYDYEFRGQMTEKYMPIVKGLEQLEPGTSVRIFDGVDISYHPNDFKSHCIHTKIDDSILYNVTGHSCEQSLAFDIAKLAAKLGKKPTLKIKAGALAV